MKWVILVSNLVTEILPCSRTIWREKQTSSFDPLPRFLHLHQRPPLTTKPSISTHSSHYISRCHCEARFQTMGTSKAVPPDGRYFLDTIVPTPSCILARVAPALRGERLLVWEVSRGFSIHMCFSTGRRDGDSHVSTPPTLLMRSFEAGMSTHCGHSCESPMRQVCTQSTRTGGRSRRIGPLRLALFHWRRTRTRGGGICGFCAASFPMSENSPQLGAAARGARDAMARPRAKSGPESVSGTRLLIAAPMRGEHYPDLGCGLFAIVGAHHCGLERTPEGRRRDADNTTAFTIAWSSVWAHALISEAPEPPGVPPRQSRHDDRAAWRDQSPRQWIVSEKP